MPKIYLCYGRDCRKAKGFEGLCEAVGEHREVRCQKICEGPVAGLKVEGRLQWFGKLRTPKRWAALVKAADRDEVGARLARRLQKKRDGKLRK